MLFRAFFRSWFYVLLSHSSGCKEKVASHDHYRESERSFGLLTHGDSELAMLSKMIVQRDLYVFFLNLDRLAVALMYAEQVIVMDPAYHKTSIVVF